MRKISYGVLARRMEKETGCPRDVAVRAGEDGCDRRFTTDPRGRR
ncbi:hypothetical protein [Streptosporangium amethystogenes]|nr:hypothetical protein [Streptosporangium amethystogenes]